MNYYIRGNKEKADQIKAAFEKKGVNVGCYNFDREDVLFFTFEAKGETYMMSSLLGTGLDNIILTHPDYQELELPVQPKFNVGDDIKTGNTIDTVAEVDYATRSYCCKSGRTIWFENQDLWHLAPKPHYDIKNFHAGMPVLVRDSDNDEWTYTSFSHITDSGDFNTGGWIWRQCIPYNDYTKHLLGTTDPCDEQYINW